MKYISINEAKLLLKKGLYRLETGAHSNDMLFYDNRTGKFVGHVENGRLIQDRNYITPKYIIVELDKLDTNDWFKDTKW